MRSTRILFSFKNSLARATIAALVGATMLGGAKPLAAQGSTSNGVFTGTVYRDSLDHPLPATEVLIATTNVRVTTDEQGNFRIGGLAPGRYGVTFRHVGFAPLVDTIVVNGTTPVDRAYELVPQAIALDPMKVREDAAPYATPRLAEFLERKKTSNGGRFITEDEIHKNDSRKLQDLIASRIPGIHVYRPDPQHRPTAEYLASGRKACRGPEFSCGGGTACAVALYVDGNPIYNPGPASANDDIPDLNRFTTSVYAGIEYYPGGASIPPQYNATTSDCGVLLLWTREK